MKNAKQSSSELRQNPSPLVRSASLAMTTELLASTPKDLPPEITPSVPISSPIFPPKNDPKKAQKWLFQPVPLKWYETPKIPQKGQNRT